MKHIYVINNNWGSNVRIIIKWKEKKKRADILSAVISKLGKLQINGTTLSLKGRIQLSCWYNKVNSKQNYS